VSVHGVLAANKEIGRRVLLELWGEGRLEVADELYAPRAGAKPPALGASQRRACCVAKPRSTRDGV